MFKILTGFYSHSHSLIKGSAAFFLMNIGGVSLNFVFAMLAGNYFGSSVWGQFTICLTVLQLLCVFSRIGLDTLIVKLVAEEHSKSLSKVKDVYFKSATITFLSGALFTVLLLLFSNTLATSFFKNTELSSQLRIISFAIIPMNMLLLNSEALKGIKYPVFSSFFRNACVWLFAMPALFISNLIFENEYLVEIYISAVIISWLLSAIILMKQLTIFKTSREEWLNYKSIAKQGFPMMLANSLFYLMVWTDTLILGVFRTESEVGVYNIAFRISMFLTLSIVAVGGVSAPDFAILNNKNDREGLQNAIDKANKLVFWTTFPAIAGIIILATPVLTIFGKEFREGSIALILLSLGRLAAILGGRLPVLSMIGKQKIDQNIALAVFIINIILNIIFVPLWGINGAAFSTMATSVAWTIITAVYMRKAMKLNALYIPFLEKKLRV
ncbi:MAG: hypothetical protein POELPBGB_02225 [Bacteroidia bacterium]|nr:hypothetical protein [Bacteroidia bacterium]